MTRERRLMLLLNTVIFLIALAVFLLFLPTLKSVAMPFLIAIILSYLLRPLIRMLMENGMRKGYAVTLVTLGTFLLLVIMVTMFVPQAVESLSKMSTSLPELVDDLTAAVDRFEDRFSAIFGESAISSEDISGLISSLSDYLNQMVDGLTDALMSSGSQAIDLVIVPIVAVLLMLNGSYFKNMFSYFVPTSGRTVSHKMATDIDRVVGGFLRGQTVMSVIAGIITGIGCAILGLPYAAVIGIITAVTSFIPYFGPFVGLLVVVLLTIWTSVLRTLILIVIFGAAQVICGNVIAPMIMTESVGVSPIGIIFSVVFFGALFGGFGMLLAVPITGTLKVLLRYLIKAAADPVSDGEPTRFTPELSPVKTESSSSTEDSTPPPDSI